MSNEVLELMDHLTVIRREQTRLWKLFADKQYGAFRESLSTIEDAARKAGFWANDHTMQKEQGAKSVACHEPSTRAA